MTERWWEARAVYPLVAMLAAAPLVWPRTPPLLDLPTHMASYHVALSLAHSTALQRFFTFHWALIGNLGADLAIMPIGRVIGVELGTKLIVIAIPVLTAIGFLIVAKQAHGTLPPTALAAVPLAYNYPFLAGFVNYSLAMALALPAFAGWMASADRGREWRRAPAFALIAAGVWICHAVGWSLLCAMCGAFTLQRRLAGGTSIRRSLLLSARDCAPLLSPLVLMAVAVRSDGLSASGFLEPATIVKWLVTAFRDRWIVLDLASAALIVLLVGTALFPKSGLTLERRLAWPAAALLALFILGPDSIDGSAFVDARIAPYALAMTVLAIDCRALTPARQQLVGALAALFLVTRIGAHTVSFLLYDTEYRRHLVALDHLPAGSATLVLAGVTCERGFGNWFSPRLYHIPSLATVRKDVFVNTNWTIGGLQLLRVRYRAAGAFQVDPSQMVTALPCAGAPDRSLQASVTRAPLAAFARVWLLNVPRPLWPQDPRLKLLWSTTDAAVFATRPPRDRAR